VVVGVIPTRRPMKARPTRIGRLWKLMRASAETLPFSKLNFRITRRRTGASGAWAGGLVSPAGGLGTSISNANYNRRPILNIVGTVDAGPSTTVWLPVMENSNPYNQPNLWSWYTNPGFAQGTMSKITADAFAKGHQMSSTLTSGSVGRVYEVWHANKGGVDSVNYNVYLAIYSKNWEGAADTEGPVVPWQGTVPPIVNLTQGSSFEVLANINDISTGNSDIQSAEYQIDGGSWTPLNPVDAFDSPAEGARATADGGGDFVICESAFGADGEMRGKR